MTIEWEIVGPLHFSSTAHPILRWLVGWDDQMVTLLRSVSDCYILSESLIERRPT